VRGVGMAASYTTREQVANSIIHGVGCVAAVIA
jgi:hypothetical protein